jgi:hypothetical protein
MLHLLTCWQQVGRVFNVSVFQMATEAITSRANEQSRADEQIIANNLEKKILEILDNKETATTLWGISAALREDKSMEFVYKHKLVEAIWNLSRAGKLCVGEGTIEKTVNH